MYEWVARRYDRLHDQHGVVLYINNSLIDFFFSVILLYV
jgi:hypothetical protein